MASEVAWETCREPGCIGVGVGDTASCWAHLGPADRDRLVAALGREGQVDARGVRFEDPSLLEALLRGCGRGTGTLLSPRFDRAQFAHPVDFSRTSFAGPASFRHSTFSGDAVFRDVVFGGDAMFEGAAFDGRADFDGAAFHGKALFGGARFASRASFAGEREVSFAGWADFTQARFGALAWFGGARFGSRVMVEGMHCADVLRMEGAVVAEARSFGPVVARAIELDRSQFRSPLRLELSCERLTLGATQFFERTTVAVRWAEIVMNEAEFGRPSLLTASEPFADGGHELDESPLRGTAGRRHGSRPRVVSLQRANIGELTMSGIDLTACRFAGAHNLDGMRVESDCLFPAPPARRRYTPRVTIADEHALRRASDGDDWWTDAVRPPDWTGSDWVPPTAVPAQQVAATYRDLRKGREDRSDAPGAADFYYGEMEMRRHAKPGANDETSRASPLGERALLGAYWLTSGYGLRASRALAALALTVLAFAVLLWLWGFEDQPFWRALLFSAESTAGLFRVPDEPPLEPVGEAIQLPLRLLGPLFFGLALLSLRGRIKR